MFCKKSQELIDYDLWLMVSLGTTNEGATFQRAMDIAFVGGKFVVIYLDDVTIFSGSDYEHLEHL